MIPRLAVFYDSSLTGDPATPGGRLAAEYFRELGYAVLTSDSLAAFFRDRIGDSVPSAVVFAMDILPSSVAPVLADTVLLTRYLKAGRQDRFLQCSAWLRGAGLDRKGSGR